MEECVIEDSSFVVRKLIDYIRDENLTTGDRLPAIPHLSEEWRIRTNVIRDGLLKAQSMGLVKIHPRVGTFIQSPNFGSLVSAFEDTLGGAIAQSDTNLVYLLEARSMAELNIIAKAAQNWRPEGLLCVRQALDALEKSSGDLNARIDADEEFHLAIAKAAGNPIMLTFLRSLLVLLRPHKISLLLKKEVLLTTEETHREIYQRIFDRDAEGARKVMEQHLNQGRKTVLNHIATLPERK